MRPAPVSACSAKREVAMLAHAKEVYDSSILVPCTRCSLLHALPPLA